MPFPAQADVPMVSKQRLGLLSLVRRVMGRHNQGTLFYREEVWTVLWARVQTQARPLL